MATPALPTLDQIVATVAGDEATYNADTTNIASIQNSIQTATAPLGPAEAKLATDTEQYAADLQILVTVAQGKLASLTVPAPPAPAPPTGS